MRRLALIALLAAGAVLCQTQDPVPAGATSRGRAGRISIWAGAAAIASVLAVTGGNLLRVGLTRHYLDDARAELAAHPTAAVVDAGRALRLDGANLDAYYVKAAGQARFGQAAPARSTLLAAVREDPNNFVTWVLLGDLEVRLRNFGAAKTFYGHAHALVPNDPTLSSLAADPARALARAGHA